MRYLNLGTVSAQASQAVYHALAEMAQPDDPPTLITVSPSQPYVCVGYHQMASREIDRALCELKGIPVGRRMVGGGAVWLDNDQVFWHLLLPGRARSIADLYELVLEAPVKAYHRMGIMAEHRPVNDLVVGPRKIGGTGASTIGDTMLVVGSILMDFDVEAMARVLRVPSEKFRDKMVAGMADYMTTVRRELGPNAPSRMTATQYLVEEFSRILSQPIVEDILHPDELERLAYLEQKLFSPSFVYRNEGLLRPGVTIGAGVRLVEGVHKAPGGLIRAVWREREGVFDDIAVSGDFFMEPSEGLEQINRALQGTPCQPLSYRKVLDSMMQGLDAPGICAEDVALAIDAAQEVRIDSL